MWIRGRRPAGRLPAWLTTRLVLQGVATLAAVAVVGVLAFVIGYEYGQHSLGASRSEIASLRADRQKQDKQLAHLQDAVAVAYQERDMAIQTASKLQDDSKNQLANVAALQEQIGVYQRLLGARGGSEGISLDGLKLQRQEDGRYRFRLLLTQVTNNSSEVLGRVTLTVLGARGQVLGVPVSTDFRCQYFQAIDGVLQLPAGAQPENVDVVAQATGKKARRLQKRFKWEIAG